MYLVVEVHGGGNPGTFDAEVNAEVADFEDRLGTGWLSGWCIHWFSQLLVVSVEDWWGGAVSSERIERL